MISRSATKVLVATAGLLAAAACGGGDGPVDPIQPGGAASLDIGTADVRFLAVGEIRQLTALVKDAAGNPVTVQVTWSSDNAAVATVDQTGLVTARGFGTTKVRATVGSIVKEATVTVVQNPQFNVQAMPGLPCTSPVLKNFVIAAQSAHLLIVSDTENPPDGFTTADYESFAAQFESLVWPVLTGNFGEPSDIDGNGKVIAFFTRAVNELTIAGSTSVVGGFFYARDLYPKTGNSRLPACPGSNQAEMFYMLVPDPNGVVNGNVRSVASVRQTTVGVIGHEFQHLINAGRRLHINTSAFYSEVTYLEEGLSHIAEELLFYTAGGVSPRSNITIQGLSSQGLTAINAYQGSNLVRFGGGQSSPLSYLKDPANSSPYTNDDDIATRGATWSWLRYLNDRGSAAAFAPAACSGSVVLPVGGACGADGSAGAQIDINSGAASSGDFVIVAFNDGSASITTDANAVGSIPVTGPPSPSVAPAGALFSTAANSLLAAAGVPLKLDMSFHIKLRDVGKRELRDRVPYARAAFARQLPGRARLNLLPGDRPAFATIAGEDAWARLVNSNDTGMVNLRAVFGQDIRGYTRDWTVAHYTDDAVQGLPAQYTHPSWNFREVLSTRLSNTGYPLPVRSLTAPVAATMINGGAAYFRVGVAAGATSTVRFTVGGAAPPAALKLAVVRTR